jgi:H+/gluconate symporter-like permease
MLMGDSGCADAIAESVLKIVAKFKNQKLAAVLSISVIGMILSIAGISTFIIVFVCMPIAKSIFQKLNIPWHLFVTYVLGIGCFTLSALPGMPSLNNIIPTTVLGTTPRAAPVLGIIGTIVMIITGTWYIMYAVKKTEKNGEGFLPTGEGISQIQLSMAEHAQPVKVWQAFIPALAVLVVLNLLNQSAELSMVVGCALVYIMCRKNLPNVIAKTIPGGCTQAVVMVSTTSVIVGFGAAAASTLGYQMVVGALNNLNIHPVWHMIIAANMIAGLLGSSSGGLRVSLEQFSSFWISSGLNPQVIHRISAMSAQGLDSLPHSSSIVVGLQACRLTHKQAYWHIFVLNSVITIIGVVVAGIFAMFGVV